jgi:hypothetical protein
MRPGWLILVCAQLLLGQKPPEQPVTKAPGDSVTLEIQATSQPTRAPVALRWEVIFPAQLMEMYGAPEAGSAAAKSGKSLQCKARTSYALSCTLSGGQNPIADGTIAIFHFNIMLTAKPGPAFFTIGRAVSTLADSNLFRLNDTQAAVNIR